MRLHCSLSSRQQSCSLRPHIFPPGPPVRQRKASALGRGLWTASPQLKLEGAQQSLPVDIASTPCTCERSCPSQAMQRPERQMRRPALAAVALLVAVAVAWLPGAFSSDWIEDSYHGPVEDVPSDGCMYVRHLIKLQPHINESYCQKWGATYVNHFNFYDSWYGDRSEVTCHHCGLENHKFFRSAGSCTPHTWLVP